MSPRTFCGDCVRSQVTRQEGKNRMAKVRKARSAGRSESKPGEAESTRPTPLNFKVSADFRREFKTYAAQHNKKLNQLLYESFAALKAKHAE